MNYLYLGIPAAAIAGGMIYSYIEQQRQAQAARLAAQAQAQAQQRQTDLSLVQSLTINQMRNQMRVEAERLRALATQAASLAQQAVGQDADRLRKDAIAADITARRAETALRALGG